MLEGSGTLGFVPGAVVVPIGVVAPVALSNCDHVTTICCGAASTLASTARDPVRGEVPLVVLARVRATAIGMMHSGQRRRTAISSAFSVSRRSLTALIAHPTTNREYRSRIAARYSLAC